MQIKTFLGKLKVTTGEYENLSCGLYVANSFESAMALLEKAAASMYGNDSDENTEPSDDSRAFGGYFANYGEVCTEAFSLTEIGLSTFLDMRRILSVELADNVAMPTEALLHESTQQAAQFLTNALVNSGIAVKHSDVLNALGASWGEKNWQVLGAKLKSPSKVSFDALFSAAKRVCGVQESLSNSKAPAFESYEDSVAAVAAAVSRIEAEKQS